MEVLPKMELNRGAADVLEVLLPSLIFKCCLQWNSIGVLLMCFVGKIFPPIMWG